MGVADGSHDDLVHHGADDEPGGHAADERKPQRQAGVGEAPHDERGEHGHLALGEVEQPGGAVDHHEAEAQHGVDRTVAEADEEEVQESFHVSSRGTPS